MRASYSLVTPADVALAAATAKTIIATRAGAAFGMDLFKWGVGFNGVTASAVPVLVELCAWTGAGAGTTTAATPVQTGGPTIAHGQTASGVNYTVEPTALTVIKSLLLTPNGGLYVEDFGRNAGLDTPVSNGFAIRCTAPAIVSARAFLEWCRT